MEPAPLMAGWKWPRGGGQLMVVLETASSSLSRAALAGNRLMRLPPGGERQSMARVGSGEYLATLERIAKVAAFTGSTNWANRSDTAAKRIIN